MRRFFDLDRPQIEALRITSPATAEAQKASEALWKGFTPRDELDDVRRPPRARHEGRARAAGFGTDFDGVEDVPDGLEDVSKLPKVTEELLRRAIRRRRSGVLGENFLRFLARVEATAARSRRAPDATPFR